MHFLPEKNSRLTNFANKDYIKVLSIIFIWVWIKSAETSNPRLSPAKMKFILFPSSQPVPTVSSEGKYPSISSHSPISKTQSYSRNSESSTTSIPTLPYFNRDLDSLTPAFVLQSESSDKPLLTAKLANNNAQFSNEQEGIVLLLLI